MGTTVDKQGQKTGKHGGGEFRWWVINVNGDGCKGRIQIFSVGQKERIKPGKLKRGSQKDGVM